VLASKARRYLGWNQPCYHFNDQIGQGNTQRIDLQIFRLFKLARPEEKERKRINSGDGVWVLSTELVRAIVLYKAER